MRVLLMICVFIPFAALQAQTVKKKNFIGTNWFSENTDSLFYKADTICFYRRMNVRMNGESKDYEESENAAIPSGYYVNLEFRRMCKLNYREQLHGSMARTFSWKFSWKFHKKSQEVWLLQNEVIFLKLRPLAQESFSIDSEYGNYQVPTIKWVFVRIR